MKKQQKQAQGMTRKEAIEQMIKMRKHYRGKPGSFNIRKAIEEGRP